MLLTSGWEESDAINTPADTAGRARSARERQ